MEKETEVSYDIWRDSYFRYLGYANEVGESFGPLYPKLIRPSYILAFGYVGCDTITKIRQSINKNDERKIIIKNGLDCFIWQTLASVLIPGKIINVIANSSTNFIKTSKNNYIINLPKSVKIWSPTLLGLVVIPFIIHPIDVAVDMLMNNSIRKIEV